MVPEEAAALVLIRPTGVLPILYFRLQAASTALIRIPAAGAEGQGRRIQRPVANAVLTTVLDTWGRSWTPKCPSESSGLLRWPAVDSRGPDNSPENRTATGFPRRTGRSS